MELTSIIKTTTNKLLYLNIIYDIEIPCIKLHIICEGGDVFAAFSILKLIETNKIPIINNIPHISNVSELNNWFKKATNKIANAIKFQ